MDTGKLMDVADAATYFGLTEYTVRKMAKEGRIPAAKLGRAYRFRKEDIDSYIKQQYKTMQPETEND